MSPTLLRYATLIYGPLGVSVGVARVTCQLHPPHGRWIQVTRGTTVIKGMPSQLMGPGVF